MREDIRKGKIHKLEKERERDVVDTYVLLQRLLQCRGLAFRLLLVMPHPRANGGHSDVPFLSVLVYLGLIVLGILGDDVLKCHAQNFSIGRRSDAGGLDGLLRGAAVSADLPPPQLLLQMLCVRL